MLCYTYYGKWKYMSGLFKSRKIRLCHVYEWHITFYPLRSLISSRWSRKLSRINYVSLVYILIVKSCDVFFQFFAQNVLKKCWHQQNCCQMGQIKNHLIATKWGVNHFSTINGSNVTAISVREKWAKQCWRYY